MTPAALIPSTFPSDSVARRYRHAEDLMAQRNDRFTPIRWTVFLRLLESDVPLGAYDILDPLGDVGSQKSPTVCRALVWLMEQGLVAKLVTNSRFIVVGADDDLDRAFLICRDCGETQTVRANNLTGSLTRSAERRGFSNVQAVLELTGSCYKGDVQDSAEPRS